MPIFRVDKIAVKTTWELNIREAVELFKMKNNFGTKIHRHKLARNKFSQDFRQFLIIKGVTS